MDEINEWGAYEASTKREAIPLTQLHGSSPVETASCTHLRDNPRTEFIFSYGTHSDDGDELGKDKAPSAKKTVAAKDGEGDFDAEAGKPGRGGEEQEAPHSLARRIFGVYFVDGLGEEDDAEEAGKPPFKFVAVFQKCNGTMPWLQPYIKSMMNRGFSEVALFVESCLRGIGQVYFQNNPIAGLLILAGMFVQSPRVTVYGLIALLCGSLTGIIMSFDESLFQSGLFGYNSFLVGLALATFCSSEKHGGYSPSILFGTVIFSSFSSVLFVMLGKVLAPHKTPPFTLPFNISTMTFLLATSGMNHIAMDPVREPSFPDYGVNFAPESITAQAFLEGTIRGVGQVFLADNIVSGILVLIGIAFCSRISAAAAFVGSAIGTGVALLVGVPMTPIKSGLLGFNPSLSMTAMLLFYAPSFGSVVIGIAAAIMTVFLQLALAALLQPSGLPVLTLPFCIVSAVFVIIQGTIPSIIPVPLASVSTAEDHFKRVQMLSDGVGLLLQAIRTRDSKHLRKSLARSLTEHNISIILDACHDDVNGREYLSLCGILKSIQNVTFGRANFMHFGSVAGVIDERELCENLFWEIAKANDGVTISKAQFADFLRQNDLTCQKSIEFACEAFDLMGSGKIDIDEWMVFAKISSIFLPRIHGDVVEFLRFVAINRDMRIDFGDIDSARVYLGLTPFSDVDVAAMKEVAAHGKHAVNFLALAELRRIIKQYKKNCTARMVPLDETLWSAAKRGSHG